MTEEEIVRREEEMVYRVEGASYEDPDLGTGEQTKPAYSPSDTGCSPT